MPLLGISTIRSLMSVNVSVFPMRLEVSFEVPPATDTVRIDAAVAD